MIRALSHSETMFTDSRELPAVGLSGGHSIRNLVMPLASEEKHSIDVALSFQFMAHVAQKTSVLTFRYNLTAFCMKGKAAQV